MFIATGIIVAAAALSADAPGTDPVWSDRFYLGDFHQTVRAVVTMPTPGGPRLFVGGSLSQLAGARRGHVGMWDGAAWHSLGEGLNGSVFSLAVYDDGGGPALYAGGFFETAGGAAAESIARWDGEQWSPLGGGIDSAPYAMIAHDDGSGPSLFAGGFFTYVEGEVQFDIARWDGEAWWPVGTASNPPNSGIYAMTTFDDGGGPALYVGGVPSPFDQRIVAKWDGYAWTDLGQQLLGVVRALAVYDDGGGPALYAAGALEIDGAPAAVAKRVGGGWVSIDGFDGSPRSLLAHDDGNGSALYVGGDHTGVGLRRWNGVEWQEVGGEPNLAVLAMTAAAGPDPALVIGGTFTSVGGVAACEIAAWDGADWAPVGSGNPGNGVSFYNAVFDLHEVGPEVVGIDRTTLCVTGEFKLQGAHRVNSIACFDGREWTQLGAGIPESTRGQTLGSFGVPPERYLYAGTDRLYRWDGAAWVDTPEQPSSRIYVLRELDLFGQRSLYAFGAFTTIGDVEVNHVARFDGTEWHPLGAGIDGAYVIEFAVYDDGTGEKLVVGGNFTHAGGEPANHVAVWDGAAWAALGEGLDDRVYALAVFDRGEGEELYVGGRFDSAGGVPASKLARWDGTEWSPLGAGAEDDVWALRVFDDGRGPALYAGGEFSAVDGVPAALAARYDGDVWEPLGSGLTGGAVFEMVEFHDAAGAALYMGGSIFSAGGNSAQGIARWGCAPCAGDADGDGLVGFSDVLRLLAIWGPCPGCPEDLNADAEIGFADVLEVLANWGSCD